LGKCARGRQLGGLHLRSPATKLSGVSINLSVVRKRGENGKLK